MYNFQKHHTSHNLLAEYSRGWARFLGAESKGEGARGDGAGSKGEGAGSKGGGSNNANIP